MTLCLKSQFQLFHPLAKMFLLNAMETLHIVIEIVRRKYIEILK